MADADFNIVGILDWEWCSATSKDDAFSSPCMMWPVGAFYDGSNELAKDESFLAQIYREKGRGDLASCVLNGRKIHRFMFALGSGAMNEDCDTRAALFMGLKDTCSSGAPPGDKAALLREWATWKAGALRKWKDEDSLGLVMKE